MTMKRYEWTFDSAFTFGVSFKKAKNITASHQRLNEPLLSIRSSKENRALFIGLNELPIRGQLLEALMVSGNHWLSIIKTIRLSL